MQRSHDTMRRAVVRSVDGAETVRYAIRGQQNAFMMSHAAKCAWCAVKCVSAKSASMRAAAPRVMARYAAPKVFAMRQQRCHCLMARRVHVYAPTGASAACHAALPQRMRALRLLSLRGVRGACVRAARARVCVTMSRYFDYFIVALRYAALMMPLIFADVTPMMMPATY